MKQSEKARVKQLRARLHGKKVPLGDRGTLPTRAEDHTVLHAKFEHSRGSLPSSVILHELTCPFLGGLT